LWEGCDLVTSHVYLAWLITYASMLIYPVVTWLDVKLWKRSKGVEKDCPLIKSNPWRFYAVRNFFEVFLFIGGIWVGIVLGL